MKTTILSPGLIQLTRLGFVNCFLVPESDGFTLIDTGLRGSGKAILATASAHHGTIRRILLTHAHGDHIGSLDELVAALGSVEVAITERSLPLLRKDLSLRPGEPQAKVRGMLPGAATRPTHCITDGELYGSLRVLFTPGHIPGHASFFDERDGTLFAGDALVGYGGLRISGDAPWYFPLPNFATWDTPTAIASARRLTDLPIWRFACGHGPVLGDKSRLDAAIDHASR